MTMTLVETIEVGSGGAASIEFTSIPQDADDLLLVVSARIAGSAVISLNNLTFNNNTGTNYVERRLIGNGSAASSDSYGAKTSLWAIWVPDNGATSNTFGNLSLYVPNYSGTAAKSVSIDAVTENNGSTAFQAIVAGSFSDTTAISSIQLKNLSGNYQQYTTASLYKIVKAA